MRILVIGSGGREHVLTWKLSKSPKVTNIFVAPGNAGTSFIATNLSLFSTQEIINWVKENSVDLVVVGPDNYLAEGIVDMLQELNVPVFGPTKAAAEIEWSKAFAKKFMKKEGVPTARYELFTDLDKAREYVRTEPFPIVIKASGLALGKGVIITNNLKEAELCLDEIMRDKIFGEAGNEVIIEEYLNGIEISAHAFCDGDKTIMFPSSQDHKRIFENDEGPNTGGMGTIALVPGITNEQLEEIKEKIILPTLQGLKKLGRPFKGVLFPGIMLTENGPKVIEFNARFGDPETQSYMRILETDLVDILFACIEGTLDKQKVNWSDKSACCIVLASGGYPGIYEKGEKITGLENMNSEDVEIFHAGTKIEEAATVTSGGRVLGITATSTSIQGALAKAYKAIESIEFEGVQFRKDIGQKSIK
ncbi:MAG: phosphoribosylamine--glycine ligase [Candidatus Zambryskibacteria bacterium RIFCSPHIGHO2_02_FULL_43_14]|uniref:Phosphoribosylamine--glycine ligase n=1 Tax=Candidatus Zambryskibacteria bacterium RIFCSPHIGHO2_02_FULL_43_14 TaxID=1802748 RepID=A0A1G2TFP9_9BACT|nr:MAG: phosphoribosylamine--glycine ligase [Candidatus Zambryskibacteria bacterium RIFCSPHIGHO2_01_FULL_43_60]OHA95878.1 MAG: phosphoribosylamine--glycine ligase [Candidatus Zambryskibacteria bacterium RIFCSPHIGHO2_02_FULL_43_14]OHB03415.1 MAG: phosphoribosylamine--glycine ligase [Candidatus Zambryskibacteria bacterium RIFCSPLOWO2_01_FULL_42_41]